MSDSLARFAAITAFAFLLSRASGLVREQVIGAQFGLGSDVDAYRLALQVPDLLFLLVSGGVLGSAFIPVFARLRTSGKEEAAWKMASGVLGLIATSVTVLTVVAWVFAPQLIQDGIARNAPEETQALAIGLMRIVLLQPLFLALAGVATAILQSFDRFTLPAFVPIAYNACIILAAILLDPLIGMYGVALGVALGGFVFFVIQLPPVIRLGLRMPTGWPLADANVRLTFALLVPRIVGQAALQLNSLLAVYLALGLGSGYAAALGFAWTLFALPVGLFGTSVGTVTFPTLSRDAGEMDLSRFRLLLTRALRGVLFFVLPASIGVILLREPIVSLVFERGAFDHEDTLLTAQPLLYTSLSMWAYALGEILPRAFYALQDTKTPVKIALSILVLEAVLMVLLVEPLQLAGLALAFSLATMAQVLMLVFALQSRIGSLVDRDTFNFVMKALLATTLMAAALWLARPLIADYSSMSLLTKLMRVGTTVTGGAAVYVLVSIGLRQEEVAILLRIARR